MKFNPVNYEEVASETDSSPNWVFITLLHKCSGDCGITDGQRLLQFAKDLDDYIYGEVNHGEEFFISTKGSKYLIGDEILADATLVFVVHGEEDDEDLNPFYDGWIEYLLDEKKLKANECV